MPWDVEDVRNLVRNAGLIALAFSAGLWCVQAIESNYHPTAKSAPIYRTSVDDRAAWLAAHTDPKSRQITSAPKLAPKPKPVLLSTVKLEFATPLSYKFEIHLYKQDGWFDTHIPVAAGKEIYVWTSQPVGGNDWIKGMIGETVFYPPPRTGGSNLTTIVALFPEDTPANTPYCKTWQCVNIPPGVVKSLKLKVFPDNAPDDVMYSVKVFDSGPSQAGPERFAPSKQREQAALAIWDRK